MLRIWQYYAFWRNADETQLEFDSRHSTTSTQALEYIPDVNPAFDKITRILKPGGAFVNISILWDHFKFYGAEQRLNEKIHDAFRAHCFHQMLPMELPGKLERRGFKNRKRPILSFCYYAKRWQLTCSIHRSCDGKLCANSRHIWRGGFRLEISA